MSVVCEPKHLAAPAEFARLKSAALRDCGSACALSSGVTTARLAGWLGLQLPLRCDMLFLQEGHEEEPVMALRPQSEHLEQSAPTTEAQKALLKLNDPQQKSKRTSLLKSADKETERSDIDSFNLKFQNMLYAPEVQTSLRKMRIPAPLACEPMVLAAVAETANEETLATDAVEALTAAAWLQLRAGTALDSFLCMVALACLCLVTWRCRYGDMEIQPAP